MALNFPNAPTVGQIYASQGVSWTWNGVAWGLTPNSPDGGAVTYVGATPPPAPSTGQMWYRTVAPVGMFIWMSDGNTLQWVQTNSGGAP